jgi:hypothetical protein
MYYCEIRRLSLLGRLEAFREAIIYTLAGR